jgi:hypothetical protein
MRNILVVILVALLPASMAAAEPSRAPKAKTAPRGRLVPAKRVVNSCATYGAGFVKVDGTDTCMKIGGAVGIGVGGSVGSGSR